MTDTNFYALIMAGGVGSRFWPLSRKKLPKQFLDILNTGSTLFQDTYNRMRRICAPENIFIVTNEIYRDIVKSQVNEITDDQILGEPHLRNTAPCVTYGAFKISKRNPNAVISVVPSDHIIMDDDQFEKAMRHGFEFCAKHPYLLTLGITPTRADTGYGYIQLDEEKEISGVYKVKTFTEKPSIDLAEHFLKSGEFLWNSGMFVWQAKVIIEEIENHLPEMHEQFKKSVKYFYTPDEKEQIQKVYELCTSISIDYGIMEKAQNVYVLPVSFRWSDVGTWNAIYEFSQKDENQNVLKGDMILTRHTKNCIVHVPNKKLVVLNGVQNLIVVEDNDILMIADKGQEQEVRQVVNEIKIKHGDKFI
jgi:mannose-1-phosphate guanylyltransferase